MRNWLSVKWGGITALLVVICLLSGCGGEAQKTQATPDGTVRLFVHRVLEQGDLESAFELLNPEDRELVKSNSQIGSFLSEDTLEKYQEYTSLYEEFKPRLLEIANRLVDVKVRKGKDYGDSAEVKLEVLYPSDYMMLAMAVGGVYTRLQTRYRDVNLDSIPLDQKKKIIWSALNDFEKSLENVSLDKKSTYLFPLTVIERDGKWWIDLQLAGEKNLFKFTP
jgi:hypothetical protein